TGPAGVGGSVRAGNDVIFTGAVSVVGNVDAGNDAVFGDGIADLIFGFPIPDAATIGGNVTAGNDATFTDFATVAGFVDAGHDATFGDGIGPDITTIGSFVTAGNDATFNGLASVTGSVTADNNIEFKEVANLGGDVLAGNDVSFRSIASFLGEGGQRVDAIGGTLRFEGAVTKGFGDITFGGEEGIEIAGGSVINNFVSPGEDGDLGTDDDIFGGQLYEDAVRIEGDIVVTAAGLLQFDGSLIQATGDILLNPDGREDIPTIATIVASDSIVIVSDGGMIIVGENEKFTGLGDVTFEALEGSVTLSDTNALGDLTVDAPEILIRTRDAGALLTFLGELDSDGGVDFVAGGRFFFSETPTLLGGGAAPVFSSPTLSQNPDALGTLRGFLFRLFQGLTPEFFKFRDTILDLKASGPDAVNLAEALAERPEDADDGEVADAVLLDPAARADLRRLGIFVRPLRPSELADTVAGRHLYNDAPTRAAQVPEDYEIAVNRLRRDSLMKVLDLYRGLVVRETLDGQTGESVANDQTAHIRATLSAAWAAYARQTPAPNGLGFRGYLEGTPDQAEALGVLNALRDLLEEVRIAGLSTVELQVCEEALFVTFAPAAMREEQLKRAVDGRPA
ncbi:MAG: hypothetical protein O7J95_01160, partial [Planctomycetota bacterium]|nr:hypothetical protein [Planctomycetota bacterium]